MIDKIFIKIFFIIVIALFLLGMIVPMVLVNRKGMDPHGTHEEASLLTRLTSVSIMIWLIYVILYFIFDDYIKNFLMIEFFFQDLFVIIGMVLLIISLIFGTLGLIALGINFRIEFPKEETQLITSGIYTVMRNPIVFGVFLILIGYFLVIPNFLNLFIAVVNIITFDSKAKDEERFLLKTFGKEYEEYKERVGRYLPFIIRKTEFTKRNLLAIEGKKLK